VNVCTFGFRALSDYPSRGTLGPLQMSSIEVDWLAIGFGVRQTGIPRIEKARRAVVGATAKGSEPGAPPPESSQVPAVNGLSPGVICLLIAISHFLGALCAAVFRFPGGFRTRRFCALVSSWPRAKEGGWNREVS